MLMDKLNIEVYLMMGNFLMEKVILMKINDNLFICITAKEFYMMRMEKYYTQVYLKMGNFMVMVN